MQIVELKLRMVIDENPHLINALNRSLNQLLVKRDSHIV